MDFPLIGTKLAGVDKKFDLTDPQTRQQYFQAKVGPEIKIINNFLANNSFIGYFLGKKNSGKGTYSKLFSEAIGSEKQSLSANQLVHLSVGDLVRETDAGWEEFSVSPAGKRLKEVYRGYIAFDEAVKRLRTRDASALLPSEFILALLRVRFEQLAGKSVFLDGFPREDDQISYALVFKELVNRSGDRDMFILIDIPDSVINERIKYRVICPVCNTPRSTKLLVTSKVGFDKKTGEFYLMCDNPECGSGARMVGKEGDNLGIAPIKDRLTKDQQILEKVYEVSGMAKTLLRNSIPVSEANKLFDAYEITPAYSYELDKDGQTVKVKEDPWVIKDNNGVDSYSLLPAAVVVSMIKQMAKLLS